MNHKERVLKALNREEPDRVPFFYWDVPEFGVKMMEHLGFSNRDQLLEFLDVDFRWVEPLYTGPKLIDAGMKSKKDIWGVGYSRVKKGAFEFWEATHFPLEGINDPGVLKDYPWPTTDLFDFSTLNKQIEKYQDYAIMTAPGYSSPGLFRIIQRILGRESFLDVMMYHPHFFKGLVEKVSEFYIVFIERFFEQTGDKVDFIRIADDFGAHGGLIISQDMWSQYCKPAIESFTALPRKLGVKFYMHSCGAVRKLLPEFVSIGADVLDPIQTRATGMEPAGLKKDFGNYITFCGALDEEMLLRGGTPKQVKQGVKELLDIMAPGGGFILGPSHKLKVETPVENVIAMYEAAREWKY
ncbi:uroporphyrinogen-III decarboxylase [Marinilabiliaceae bacterium JC017]|nr:uroporphyrinogen-III decarboxylase [Marinilabiliaceae bacterium JC017]